MFSLSFRSRKTVLTFLLLLMVVLLPFQGSGSLARSISVLAPSRPSADPSDPHELERFLDQVLGKQLAKQHIPGATISVVKNGRLFFAKGYGFADLQHHIPVHAATTLFRIGSVSKLFTWTAVMQLVEQGKLDLHTNVNRYLKSFQIPAIYPQPITLAHLLTHTAGFEDAAIGYYARTPQELEPLGTWLATHIPARVRPPGKLASYSNYGADLAGYIVEQVSGLPFDQYIEEKIFAPLHITPSMFRQPVPARLQPFLSQGYLYSNGVNRAAPFTFMQDAPDGAMSSTATDMANFMLAHLQNGRFDNQQILQEATTREMRQRQFTSDMRLPGVDYGFYEMHINQLHLIAHGGDIEAFHSLLALLPAQHMGLFVSYNSSSGAGVPHELLQAFLDHYFPAPRPQTQTTPPLAGFAQRANQVVGTYWPIRRNYTTFEKVGALFDRGDGIGVVHVNNAGKGRLAMTGGSSVTLHFVEVSPWVFQQVGGSLAIAFQTRPEGTIMFLDNSLNPYMKVAWYETRTFQYALLLVCLLIFLSALLLWAFQLVRLMHRGQTRSLLAGPPLARWLAGAACLLNLIIMGTLVVQIFTEQVKDLAFGMQPWLVAIFLLALVSALLTIGVLVCALLAWGKRWWGTASRIHYTLVALAALVFALELAYWNLLSFHA